MRTCPHGLAGIWGRKPEVAAGRKLRNDDDEAQMEIGLGEKEALQKGRVIRSLF
jgi:hypothetical protein